MTTKEFPLVINGQNYIVTSNEQNEEAMALIIKALENFYELAEKKEAIDFEFNNAKLMIEQMMEKAGTDFGFKSIKSQYYNAAFVPSTPPKEKEKPNIEAIEKMIEELGMTRDSFFITEMDKGRKASFRWSKK